MLTPFNRAELCAALHQKSFWGHAEQNDLARIWQDFESDCRSGVWQCVGFPSSAWQTTIDLSMRFAPTLGVRTLDVLHVASALELGVEEFWTFDERQARLAKAVGLATDS